MSDFLADGQPYETPLASANEAYAATPPSLSDAIGAMFHENSTIEPMTRWMQRQVYQPTVSGLIGRAMMNAGAAEAGAPPVFDQALSPAPATMLSAEEANGKYAPTGPDGNKVPITDAPIPEPVAQMIAKEKADQIERDGVIARFQNAHGMITNFAAGTAGFLMDPLNLATAFVPGFGEEAVAGALGGGLLARVAGRAASGAAAGLASQAPLVALRYGLSQDEADGYQLRDAFRDLFYAAAGNALFSAGLGTAGELLGRKPALDAATQHDNMAGAVGEMVDGRPVDVAPNAADQAQLYREGYAPGMSQDEFATTHDAIYGPEADTVRAEVSDEAGQLPAFTPDERAGMLPEERAQIDAAEKAVTEADKTAAMYDEAGACLGGL